MFPIPTQPGNKKEIKRLRLGGPKSLQSLSRISEINLVRYTHSVN